MRIVPLSVAAVVRLVLGGEIIMTLSLEQRQQEQQQTTSNVVVDFGFCILFIIIFSVHTIDNLTAFTQDNNEKRKFQPS